MVEKLRVTNRCIDQNESTLDDKIANENAVPRRKIDDNIVITTKVALNMMLRGKGGGYAAAGRCLNRRTRLNVVDNVSNSKLTYMPYCCGLLRDDILRKVR